MTKSEFNIQRDMWKIGKDSEDNHKYNKRVKINGLYKRLNKPVIKIMQPGNEKGKA